MAGSAKREPLSFLVVMAHPHDFTHCAGTCGIHIKMGDSVTVVTMTDGARKHNERFMDELMKPETERDPEVMSQTPDQYAEKKANEIRGVCAIFGVTDRRTRWFSHCPVSITSSFTLSLYSFSTLATGNFGTRTKPDPSTECGLQP